ncbi:uncharacterized protein LOC122660427 isoform X2 [Telopea speciosissima]|uniref:uncharacterized protein LOC122660427 isoform X2 n=1 Tax=Telopea speciosissima TaxID=54955 RepID=UPI001CC3CF5D|nr:uncharacterized protein LOC122660427 isoform X2 [Telopea speciosissima]
MSCSLELSRLCSLIEGALRPYTEKESIELTKDEEKDLLITLSKISGEIQRWGDEIESDSENEAVANHVFDVKCFPELDPPSGGHSCLVEIVSVVAIFLEVGSQYIKHLAGNLLVVISKFIAKAGSKWSGFLYLLCVCLDVAISNNLSSLTVSSTSRATDSECNALSFISILHSRLVNANWHTVAGLFRVLRNIMKYLKQNNDGDLLKIYMDSISNVCWELLSEIHVGQTNEVQINSTGVALLHRNVCSPESRFLFLGGLLQLFCSLVEQNDLVESKGVLDKIVCLVPKLLNLCFYKQGDFNNSRFHQYMRHKMLMLMVRLSFQINWECSTLVLWLELLHFYFEDLILLPISARDALFDDCVEGSPFLTSVPNVDIYRLSTRHLQRQAIFLFLKCSFHLVSLGQETDKECACVTSNSCLTCESQSDLESCCRKKGLSELSAWLKTHLPLEAYKSYPLYLEKCNIFAISFLQLFIDEDDLLFEMLLQLLTLPFPAEQFERYKDFQEVSGDILFHLSSIFNAVHLFHLFLAELHYDHQVLLDYLISKDTGVNCVQYLLRCFRMIFKSWHLFVEFSVCESEISQPSCKKRKIILDSQDSNGKVDLLHGETPVALDRDRRRKHDVASKPYDEMPKSFKNAKDCLLSLKRSVKNLHQKNLFPYNPTALLRSFMKFEELCQQKEKEHVVHL